MIDTIHRRMTINTFLFFFLIFWAAALLVLSLFIYFKPVPFSLTKNPTSSHSSQTALSTVFITTDSIIPTPTFIREGNFIWTPTWALLTEVKTGPAMITVKLNDRALQFRYTPKTQTLIIKDNQKQVTTGFKGLSNLYVGQKIKVAAYRNHSLIKVIAKL